MHFPRFSKILGLLPLLLVGCSTTAASRFGGTPQSKSITVVGERPLPVSTGEPGGKVVASEQEPEPRRNPRTRISGRVLDQSGEPVSGAIVRLADGGGKGGREIRATSDQSRKVRMKVGQSSAESRPRPPKRVWRSTSINPRRRLLTGAIGRAGPGRSRSVKNPFRTTRFGPTSFVTRSILPPIPTRSIPARPNQKRLVAPNFRHPSRPLVGVMAATHS